MTTWDELDEELRRVSNERDANSRAAAKVKRHCVTLLEGFGFELVE